MMYRTHPPRRHDQPGTGIPCEILLRSSICPSRAATLPACRANRARYVVSTWYSPTMKRCGRLCPTSTVTLMFDAYSQNDLLLSMLTTIAGEKVDLKVAEKAFAATRGDFRAKFTAAMETRMAQLAVPEVFVELPLDPAVLLKADLEKLVRPVAASFLRSHPSKDELLDQATRIRLRQERRPAWIPRLDTDRRPIPSRPSSGDDETPPERLLVVATLPELGEVTVRLPESWAERPELSMSPGGIGEWEAALFALLGVAA